MDRDGSADRVIEADRCPTYSADGGVLAWLSYDGRIADGRHGRWDRDPHAAPDAVTRVHRCRVRPLAGWDSRRVGQAGPRRPRGAVGSADRPRVRGASIVSASSRPDEVLGWPDLAPTAVISHSVVTSRTARPGSVVERPSPWSRPTDPAFAGSRLGQARSTTRCRGHLTAVSSRTSAFRTPRRSLHRRPAARRWRCCHATCSSSAWTDRRSGPDRIARVRAPACMVTRRQVPRLRELRRWGGPSTDHHPHERTDTDGPSQPRSGGRLVRLVTGRVRAPMGRDHVDRPGDVPEHIPLGSIPSFDSPRRPCGRWTV